MNKKNESLENPSLDVFKTLTQLTVQQNGVLLEIMELLVDEQTKGQSSEEYQKALDESYERVEINKRNLVKSIIDKHYSEKV